ncbi:MAG: hypothetical protein AB7P02_23970 [Alphaproteobacteria bacterium]
MSATIIPFAAARPREDLEVIDLISRAELRFASVRVARLEAEIALNEALRGIMKVLPAGSTISDAAARYSEIAASLAADSAS